MKSIKLIPLIALLAGSSSLTLANTTLYTENFDYPAGESGSKNLSAVGWQVYGSSLASTPSTSTAAIRDEAGTGTDNGILYAYYASSWNLAAFETGLNLDLSNANQAYSVSLNAAQGQTSNSVQLMLQIAGQWYVSTVSYKPVTYTSTTTAFTTPGNLLTFDLTATASAWKSFTVTPGTSMSLGSVIATDLDFTKAVTGIGLYLTNTSGTATAVRFDSLALTATPIPEPAMIALILGCVGILLGVRSRRRFHQ